MHEEPSTDDPSARSDKAYAPSGFQFSVAAMFWLTALAAVAATLIFITPNWITVPAMGAVSVTLPAVLVVVLVYGRGWLKSIAIGALFPIAVSFVCTAILLIVYIFEGSGRTFSFRYFDRYATGYRVTVIFGWVTAICAALCCTWVRSRAVGRAPVLRNEWLSGSFRVPVSISIVCGVINCVLALRVLYVSFAEAYLVREIGELTFPSVIGGAICCVIGCTAAIQAGPYRRYGLLLNSIYVVPFSLFISNLIGLFI